MLGLYPIGSRAIASSSFGLTAVSAALAATVTITLSVGAIAGIIAPASASLPITFGLGGNWIVRQAISANCTITFNGTPTLRVAGKPIVLVALPQSFTLRAMQESFTAKAVPQNFTIRGAR